MAAPYTIVDVPPAEFLKMEAEYAAIGVPVVVSTIDGERRFWPKPPEFLPYFVIEAMRDAQRRGDYIGPKDPADG